ncbi:sporulation sigma-E factor-processing peptidase [Clostridia bacterium]|nr:sporulation sigma-E factor-processing peptidase [Clostridia bacterium]
MKQIVYADVVFLLNFCMDFLALFAVGKVLKLKMTAWRLILSSAAGAAYAVSVFFIEDFIVPDIVIHIAVSVAMCFIAYKIDGIAAFTKIFLIFYSACFMLGGGIEALYHISGTFGSTDIEEFGVSRGNADSPPVLTIFIFAAAVVGIIIAAGRLFKSKAAINEAKITIILGGKSVTIPTLVDSGNLLTDPLSSLPVIIMTLGCAAKLLDLDVIEYFTAYELSGSKARDMSACTSAQTARLAKIKFRMIPVRGVGTLSENKLLPGFIPDKITSAQIRTSEIRAIVAVDAAANKSYSDKFDAILPSVLLEM